MVNKSESGKAKEEKRKRKDQSLISMKFDIPLSDFQFPEGSCREKRKSGNRKIEVNLKES